MQGTVWYSVLFVIHVMVTIGLIAIILVQRNAGDMGLSSSSSTSFMSGRAAASFVTRTTAVLATIFILLSLILGIITTHSRTQGSSILDKLGDKSATEAPLTSKPEPVKPAKPAVPRPE
jgi:preprotein translocase subunit SecG